MKAKTREPRWGRKSGPDRNHRAEQEGEGATTEGLAGGERQIARHGLNYPGRSGKQPRTGSSGRVGPMPRTGSSGRAGKNQHGPLDWNIRRAEEPRRHAPRLQTGASGEAHNGKQQGPEDWNIWGGCVPRPWTGTSVDRGSRPGLERPGLHNGGREGSGSKNKTPRNERSSGEGQQARDHPGQT